jgi:hypothetical protein
VMVHAHLVVVHMSHRRSGVELARNLLAPFHGRCGRG